MNIRVTIWIPGSLLSVDSLNIYILCAVTVMARNTRPFLSLNSDFSYIFYIKHSWLKKKHQSRRVLFSALWIFIPKVCHLLDDAMLQWLLSTPMGFQQKLLLSKQDSCEDLQEQLSTAHTMTLFPREPDYNTTFEDLFVWLEHTCVNHWLSVYDGPCSKWQKVNIISPSCQDKERSLAKWNFNNKNKS